MTHPKKHLFPTLSDLERLAERYGAPVLYGPVPSAALAHDKKGPRAIIIPEHYGGLRRVWALAHELGHLHHGHGWLFQLRDYHETEADHWAAEALLPDPCLDPDRDTGEILIEALGKVHQPDSWPSGGTQRIAVEILEARSKT